MNFITRTPVLWALFVLMISANVAFVLLDPLIGGNMLDLVSSEEDTRRVFNALTPEQKTAHFWITILLDTLYPLTFGLLFAGLAWRFFGKWGAIAAIPGFAVMIVDLTENMIQALALSGAADLLDAKAWVTPLKVYLFLLAAAIALVAVIIAVVRLVRKKRSVPIS